MPRLRLVRGPWAKRQPWAGPWGGVGARVNGGCMAPLLRAWRHGTWPLACLRPSKNKVNNLGKFRGNPVNAQLHADIDMHARSRAASISSRTRRWPCSWRARSWCGHVRRVHRLVGSRT